MGVKQGMEKELFSLQASLDSERNVRNQVSEQTQDLHGIYLHLLLYIHVFSFSSALRGWRETAFVICLQLF